MDFCLLILKVLPRHHLRHPNLVSIPVSSASPYAIVASSDYTPLLSSNMHHVLPSAALTTAATASNNSMDASAVAGGLGMNMNPKSYLAEPAYSRL